jgi:hypothetical protein
VTEPNDLTHLVEGVSRLSWIERVRAADAEAEMHWGGLCAPHIDAETVIAHALIAIAAELRAQRIARRPGAGQ